MKRSNIDGGGGKTAGDGARAGDAARAPLWRPRPPRRPRRRRRRSALGSAGAVGAAEAAAGCSKTVSCCPSVITSSISLGCSSENSAMIGAGALAGSAVDSLTATTGVASVGAGIGAPRRVRASSAFCFHCGRRKRSAAVVNHRTAPSLSPPFSKICASSNATIASCVRSYKAESWPGGSALVRALRMRAWICRQSLTAGYCNSRTRFEHSPVRRHASHRSRARTCRCRSQTHAL